MNPLKNFFTSKFPQNTDTVAEQTTVPAAHAVVPGLADKAWKFKQLRTGETVVYTTRDLVASYTSDLAPYGELESLLHQVSKLEDLVASLLARLPINVQLELTGNAANLELTK